MALKSMKYSAAEKKAEAAEYVGGMAHPPEYPYGLRLDLDVDQLKKLGVGPMPVGTEIMITAKAHVCSRSEHETEGNEPSGNLGLQITDMELNALGGSSGAADKLYPAK